METRNNSNSSSGGGLVSSRRYSGPGSAEAIVTLESVTERRQLPSLGARLKALRLWLEDDLMAVEEALSAFVAHPDDSVDRHAAEHMLKARGKLLRPICVLLASRVAQEREPQVVRDIAVAVELVHAATLMHDDVLDLGTERRGQPTARLMYSNAASVLGGDFLLMRALQLINRHGHAHEMALMLEVIEEMVSAE
ncbi:MAG: polyprenyl synthetase family protein, partial [Myxococcota bacterium]